jgi:hypothetical protein
MLTAVETEVGETGDTEIRFLLAGLRTTWGDADEGVIVSVAVATVSWDMFRDVGAKTAWITFTVVETGSTS